MLGLTEDSILSSLLSCNVTSELIDGSGFGECLQMVLCMIFCTPLTKKKVILKCYQPVFLFASRGIVRFVWWGLCDLIPIQKKSVKKQVLLQLCYAITIHNSPGMTLNEAVVDIGPKEFSCGLTCVALSRVRTIKVW